MIIKKLRCRIAFREKQKRAFTKISNLFLDLKIERIRKTKRVYQPAFLPQLDWKLQISDSKKVSLGLQLTSITSRIGERESVLDIGSNLGFLSLNIARQFPQSIVWGIEPDEELVEAANRSAEKAKMFNAKFQALEINPLNVDSLPTFDNVLMLSVYQQWVRSYGIDESHRMLKIVLKKTKKRMFFSMATTNGSPKILKYFPNMGASLDESDNWIIDNILRFHKFEVGILGRHETTYESTLPRTLFLLTRK